jgi:DNA-binding CsgD family transcriptional regulator
VAFYYSGSLIVSAFIIYFFMGFKDDLLFIGMSLLPLLTVACVYRSYRYVPKEHQPKPDWGHFSFPWKPTILMAVYGFAYGMQEPSLYQFIGPHSSPGAMIAGAIVLVGIVFSSKHFDFTLIYRIALPVMVGGFLLVPAFGDVGETISGLCISMSYASFSILAMLILSNITYRFGIAAVWLFGIERGVRALFMYFGRELTNLLAGSTLSTFVQSTTFTIVVVILVVVMTMVLLSEKDLSSRWGITFSPAEKNSIGGDRAAYEQRRLAEACSDLSRRYKLSSREEEVLFLLALRRDAATIENELFIANGTLKAHTRHIYTKMGIHKRQELYKLLGINDE